MHNTRRDWDLTKTLECSKDTGMLRWSPGGPPAPPRNPMRGPPRSWNSPHGKHSSDSSALGGRAVVSDDALRILAALRGGPRRFADLRRSTRLPRATLNRHLKKLVREMLVFARMLSPERGRIPAEFRLSPFGLKLLAQEGRVRPPPLDVDSLPMFPMGRFAIRDHDNILADKTASPSGPGRPRKNAVNQDRMPSGSNKPSPPRLLKPRKSRKRQHDSRTTQKRDEK